MLSILILLLVVFSSGGDYNGVSAKMYKSPSCGCCGNYLPYLNSVGFDVEVVPTANMDSVKTKYNIPQEMQSCHTSLVEGYFIEGHVPQEAIDKLLEERPDIDGITLPNMPSGSPGMPGQKVGDFIVYSIHEGEISEFMRI